MQFSYNAEQRAWQMKAREFAEEDIRPISLQRDQVADPAGTFDWEIIKKGSKLGFRTAAVPKKWGGHGVDTVTQALIMSELARGDSAIAKTFSQCWKWALLVADRCTPQQAKRFLEPFIEDDTFLLGGGITEPNAGSDNRLPPENDPGAGLRLRAERDGDEWVLNGEKCYIANANTGRLFFVYTRTNPNVPVNEGTSIFAVPLGTSGFRIGKVFNKAGWRFYQNGELIFENARVPAANLVGELNSGLKARTGLAGKLIELEYAANAIGICDAAVEMAVRCGREYWQTPQQRQQNQAIQLKVAEMHMLTEALRAYVMRAAARSDDSTAPKAPGDHFPMVFSCDTVQRVCRLNLDIHARTGDGTMNAGADKLMRDAFIWTHIAGDTVQRLAALKPLLK